MGAAIELRADFDGATLRCLARKTKTAKQSRRLPALAGICDGGRRGDAARIGGVGLQPKLDDTQRQALAAIVEGAPTPEVHGVVRWRLSDLAQWLHAEFAVSLHETTVSRKLGKLGHVRLTARPRHHAQDTEALEAFKKRLRNRAGKGARSPPARPCNRGVVPRVSHWNAIGPSDNGERPRRSENQDHAPVGETRNTPLGTA